MSRETFDAILGHLIAYPLSTLSGIALVIFLVWLAADRALAFVRRKLKGLLP